jgi:hypothetical protein
MCTFVELFLVPGVEVGKTLTVKQQRGQLNVGDYVSELGNCC